MPKAVDESGRDESRPYRITDESGRDESRPYQITDDRTVGAQFIAPGQFIHPIR